MRHLVPLIRKSDLPRSVTALDALPQLFDRERSPRKRIVISGDFHWFDSDPQQFARAGRLSPGAR